MATETSGSPGLGRVRRSDLPAIDLSAPPYNLRGDDSTDNSPAINAILADIPPQSTMIFGKSGIYRFSEQILLDRSYPRLVGLGPWTTHLKYTGGAGSFIVGNVGSGEAQFGLGIEGMALSATDTSASKIAIDLVDARSARLDHVVVNGWSGGDSVGLRTRGREFLQVRGCQFGGTWGGSASKLVPIRVSQNPNTDPAGWLSADVCIIEDTLLVPAVATDSLPWAGIVIDDTTQVSKTDIVRVVVAGGKYGLYWNAASIVTALPSDSLNIKTFRKEQTPAGQTPTGVSGSHAIFINIPSGGMRTLRIEDFTGELSASNPSGGLYCRGVDDVSLCNFYQQGGVVNAFDVDANSLTVDNVSASSNATFAVGADMRLSMGAYKEGRHIPSSGTWKKQSTSRWLHQPNLKTGEISQWSYWIEFEDETQANMPFSANQRAVSGGVVEVFAYNAGSTIVAYGVFGLSVGNIGSNGIDVLVDSKSNLAVTDTDTKLCLFANGASPLYANVLLKNRLGETVKVIITARAYRSSDL